MKKLTQALIASTALLLIQPTVSAQTLWRDSINYDPLGGSGTYGQGGYTELHQNDLNRNSLYDSTLKDRNGNYYDCNSLGTCHQRY